METENIIEVNALNKIYKLYAQPKDRFFEAIGPKNSKRHKDRYALQDIQFDVKRGETVGIIGTNGSGKSTLLKIITGVLSPSSGEITVRGKVSALLELGAGFNPEYTGIENIYLNGRMMNYTKREMDERLENIIQFADIGDYIYQPVKMYSSGMFARLAFAVAINVEPEILIVDEALSVGDIFFQNKCFKKFEDLRTKGVTILFVSHDLESVKAMTSRVLWIEQGRQMMFGDKLEVCNEYAKSILFKNNEISCVGEIDSPNTYHADKFEMSQYPPIIKNSNNLLNEKVRILSCFFEDMNSQIVYDIVPCSRYRLVIIFETHIQIDNCIVGFVLQTKKGVALINTNSLCTGLRTNFTALKESFNRVEFEFAFPSFYSDEYIIDCAVANGKTTLNNIMYTWCYGAAKVMVSNPAPCLAIYAPDCEVKVYESLADA